MFMRGKKDLLRLIIRNQKKSSKENSEDIKEEKKKVEPDYSYKLAIELDKIRKEQTGLESMITDMEKKNEENDLSVQMMMSSFYKK